MIDISELRIPELKKYAAKLRAAESRSNILAWIHEYYAAPVNPNQKYLAVFLAGEVSAIENEAMTQIGEPRKYSPKLSILTVPK